MSEAIVEDKCSECGYWKAEEGEKAGVCKRYPLHQEKSSEDWCGEFEPREEGKEKVKKAGTWGRGEKE